MGSAAATPEVLARLIELRDWEWAVRYPAAEALAWMGDPDEAVRGRAAEGLGRMGSAAATPEVLAQLTECLHDPQKAMRRRAAEALGQMGSAAATPEVLARLIELLRDPDEDLRYGAATALGRLGSAAATAEVLACLAALGGGVTSVMLRVVALEGLHNGVRWFAANDGQLQVATVAQLSGEKM
jgi:HEAT repeat protein